MDEFKVVVTLAILVSLVTLGTIIYISADAVNSAEIPDIERGTVTSKAPLSENQPADYKVTLAGTQALYIQNNVSLYERIHENQTYLFDCRIDFNNKIILIENATLIPP